MSVAIGLAPPLHIRRPRKSKSRLPDGPYVQAASGMAFPLQAGRLSTLRDCDALQP